MWCGRADGYITGAALVIDGARTAVLGHQGKLRIVCPVRIWGSAWLFKSTIEKKRSITTTLTHTRTYAGDIELDSSVETVQSLHYRDVLYIHTSHPNIYIYIGIPNLRQLVISLCWSIRRRFISALSIDSYIWFPFRFSFFLSFFFPVFLYFFFYFFASSCLFVFFLFCFSTLSIHTRLSCSHSFNS